MTSSTSFVVVLLVSSFILSEALKCYTSLDTSNKPVDIKLRKPDHVCGDQPEKKCAVSINSTSNQRVYHCGSDDICDEYIEMKSKNMKRCCCSGDNCNNDDFMNTCAPASSSYTLKGFWPIATLVCGWMVYMGIHN